MPDHPHLQINVRAEQRQIMTFALHQALQILQMQQLELNEWIQEEIIRNPVLEHTRSPTEKPLSLPLETFAAAQPTLREHLMRQTLETFADKKDQRLAEYLINQLDERGWLTSSLNEYPFDQESIMRVLLVIQTFDPPGIGARNLQESLWLQLRSHSYSLAEIIVRDHFNDLLQGRFALIQKHLGISASHLQKALHRISRLQLRPASQFEQANNQFLSPDLTIKEIDSGWIIEVGTEDIPPVQIHQTYVDLVPQLKVKEEKTQLRGWVTSARWLQRCLRRRREILCTIGRLLIKKQRSYLTATGNIVPIEIKELALILNVNASTAWRAVANKMLACPNGMIPLKTFFSESVITDPVKEQICRMIQSEDRLQPLTDIEIMKKLQEKNIQCARRTIAKYRRALRINTASERKVMKVRFAK